MVADPVVSGISRGVRSDPFRGFKFRVQIDGFGSEVAFSKVTGLTQETEVVEYREGDDPVTMRKLPGLTTFEDIVLERGLQRGNQLELWREEVVQAGLDKNAESPDGTTTGDFRRNVVIKMFDKNGENVKTWEVFAAWPMGLEIPDLDAASSDVIIQTLTLANEGWRLAP